MSAPVIRGLRHLALRVTDLRRSRAFYECLFGMRVVWQPDSDHLYLSSGSDNLALHQIPAAELADYNGPRGQFMDHFGLVVDTPQAVDRMFEWIERSGGKIVRRPKRHRDGSYSFYLADPDGNTMQILYEPTISALELVPHKGEGSAMSRQRNAATGNDRRTLDLPPTVLFVLVTLAALIGVPLFGYVHGYTRLDWAMCGVLYMVSGLGITVGYHRLIAHGSFRCPDWVKAALLIAGGWALENSALTWAADHARHHARVDQEEDPYNATRGFWYSHCGWVFLKDPHRTEQYAPWLREDRVVMWQHRWYARIVLSGLALPFVVGLLAGGGLSGLSCFLLAGVGRVFLVLNSTFCINSVCHLWGSQPYSRSNSSRDSWWVSLITFGEGYHNYHHAYPRDYRNGPRRYNFDPSKWLIYGLFSLGLARDLVRR